MEWLSQNWVWVLFIGAFIAMHVFGHGGHGGHGGSGDGHDDGKPTSKDGEPRSTVQPHPNIRFRLGVGHAAVALRHAQR